MKTSKYWLSALAAALGCAAGFPCFGDETNDESYQGQPVFRPALVQQQVPTSRWDAQEPVETPEQDVLAPVTPGTCVCAEPCDFGLQLVAGAEATFLWPQLSRTFLETGFANGLGTVDIINDTALGSADGSLLIGPRITLGVQGDCWGLVGRYWNSATFGNGFVPAIPDAAQSGVILFDTFRAYTLDLEVQRRFCWRNWDSFAFFGVRYASVDNDRNLWIQNTFGPDVVEASAFAAQQFNGTGLTFGIFGLRPLFCDGGALKAYFTNRYSVLWGNGVALVQTHAAAQNATTSLAGQSTDGALAIGDGGLFIMELGFGLQWESCLKCLPGRAFLRTGLEWQYWDANAGVYAGSLSFADVITASSGAFTETGDLLFDMVGFTLGAGITY
jgi:hypothetical protein